MGGVRTLTDLWEVVQKNVFQKEEKVNNADYSEIVGRSRVLEFCQIQMTEIWP